MELNDKGFNPRSGIKTCKYCLKSEGEVSFYRNRNTVCSECTKIQQQENYGKIKGKKVKIEQEKLNASLVSSPEEKIQDLQSQVDTLSGEIDQLYAKNEEFLTYISKQNELIEDYMSSYESILKQLETQQSQIDSLKSLSLISKPIVSNPIVSKSLILGPKKIIAPVLVPAPVSTPSPEKTIADKYISKIKKDAFTRDELEELARKYKIGLSGSARINKETVKSAIIYFMENNKALIY